MRLLILILLSGLALASPLNERDEEERPIVLDEEERPIHHEPERPNIEHMLIKYPHIPHGDGKDDDVLRNLIKIIHYLEASINVLRAVLRGDNFDSRELRAAAPSWPAEPQRAV